MTDYALTQSLVLALIAVTLILGCRAYCIQALWQRRVSISMAEEKLVANVNSMRQSTALFDFWHKGKMPTLTDESDEREFHAYLRSWRNALLAFWLAKENLGCFRVFARKASEEFKETLDNKISSYLDTAFKVMKSDRCSGHLLFGLNSESPALDQHITEFLGQRIKYERKLAKSKRAREELEQGNA